MAEDVIIQGFGEGRQFPDFATEATIKAVYQALVKANVASTASAGHLASIALGEKRGAMAMQKLQKEMKDATSAIEKQTKQSSDADDDAAEQDKIQGNYLKSLLLLTKEGNSRAIANFKASFQSDQEAKKLLEENKLSDDSDSVLAGLKGVGGLVKKAADAMIAVGAAVMGANNYFLQQGQDRFNFAQELRQSGLASGMDTASASMTGFADVVRQNSFTLGEAAAFTQRFSQAVGVTGVDGALNFVKSLAYATDDGGDMMRRYGMEFGEVGNIAGEYLDSVRSLGMLDRMSSGQLRAGMDDFMSTVVATSNVMKINMEDAAQMIKNTLKRDDITALLGTLDPEKAAQIQDVVGMAGGMQDAFGEAIAQRLATGSQQSFMQTEAFRKIQSSPIAMDILPLIERLASAAENNGTEGFQREFANMSGDIDRLREVGTANRVLFTSGADQVGAEIFSSLMRLNQTAGDADSGFTPLSADDIAAVGATDVSRQFIVAMEGINTQLVKAGGFAENITKLNTANLGLITSLEAEGSAVVTEYADDIVGVTVAIQTAATDAINGLIEKTGSVAGAIGLFGDEALRAKNNVLAFNEAVEGTFGRAAPLPVTGPIVVDPTIVVDPFVIDPEMNVSSEGFDEYARKMAEMAEAKLGGGAGPEHGSEYNYPDPNAEITTEPVVVPIVETPVLPEIAPVVRRDPIVPALPLPLNPTNSIDISGLNFEEIETAANEQKVTVERLEAKITELENARHAGRLGAREQKITENNILIQQLQELVRELRN